jgi:3alpha(or 20beta)-hydroxysteroid dehydrogenase
MGRLEGKVALMSGGARGQGATEARLFAQEGTRVVVGDILDAAGKQVEEASAPRAVRRPTCIWM